MDVFVQYIQNNPDPSHLKKFFRERMESLIELASVCIGNSTQLLQIIEGINFPDNLIPVSLLLSIQSEYITSMIQDSFNSSCLLFFQIFIQNSGQYSKEVLKISKMFVISNAQNNQSHLTIRPLKALLEYFRPVNILTSIHSSLLNAFISSQMYHLGYAFIGEFPVSDINPSQFPLTTLDYLEYYYYSGICQLAMKDFTSALGSFDLVISAPAQCASVVVVEAYKKAFLASLLSKRRLYQIPCSASSEIQKIFSNPPPFYERLARSYLSGDSLKVEELLVLGQEELSRDGNSGLAKQLLGTLKKNIVLDFSKTHSTVSLGDFNELAQLDQALAEKIIRYSIYSQDIGGSIDKESQIANLDNKKSTLRIENLIRSVSHNLEHSLELYSKLTQFQGKLLNSNTFATKLFSQIKLDDDDDHDF